MRREVFVPNSASPVSIRSQSLLLSFAMSWVERWRREGRTNSIRPTSSNVIPFRHVTMSNQCQQVAETREEFTTNIIREGKVTRCNGIYSVLLVFSLEQRADLIKNVMLPNKICSSWFSMAKYVLIYAEDTYITMLSRCSISTHGRRKRKRNIEF